jgi:hypothetical protein
MSSKKLQLPGGRGELFFFMSNFSAELAGKPHKETATLATWRETLLYERPEIYLPSALHQP